MATNRTISDSLSFLVPAHVCWAIFGLVGGCTNFLVFITVLKSKILRTKSQFLVASMSLVDSFYGWTFFGTGLHRYFDYLKNDPGTSLICAARTYPLILLATTSNCFKLGLSIDRFLAVVHPIFYRTQKTFDYIRLFNIVIWIYTIPETLPLFVGYNSNLDFAMCTAQAVYKKWFAAYTGIVSMIKVITTLIIYLISITVLSRRLKAVGKLDNFQRSAATSKLELNTFKTLMVIAIVYMISSTTGFFAYLIIPLISVEFGVLAIPYFSLLFIFDCISNFFILLLMSPTFRKALTQLLSLKSNRVRQLNVSHFKASTRPQQSTRSMKLVDID